MTARADVEQSRVLAVGAVEGVVQARDRLRLVMGIASLETIFAAQRSPLSQPAALEVAALVDEAASSRPDLRAAAMLVAAAQHRLTLARKAWLRIDGAVDGNSGGNVPSNVGPGLRLDIPIFNKD